MSVIKHAELPQTRGYFSKITNRKVVNREIGAQTCEVWDQTVPVGGYIVPHYHDFEETLTFLTGDHIEVTIDGQILTISADTTVFIAPGVMHSVRNLGKRPARLIALLVSAEPKVIYPDRDALRPVEYD